uniref:TNFR-Cys domain-containing protein n=1 Tax=Magallana gigas TaxID=29159 RepID=A0A8W8J7Z1_MAGGI
MFVDFSIRTISIVILVVPSSFAQCKGNLMHEPCCVGEKWNVKEGKCIACPTNHFGKNCTFTCSVPENGYRCSTGQCRCNRISCKVKNSSPKCVASQTTPSLNHRTLPSFLSTYTVNSTVKNSLKRDMKTTSKHTIFAISPTTSFLTLQNNTVELSTMKRKGFLMYIVVGCGIVVCTLIVFQCLTIIRKRIVKGHRQRSREGEPQDPVYSEIML